MVEAGIDTIGSVQKQIDSLKEEMNEEASLIGESIGYYIKICNNKKIDS